MLRFGAKLSLFVACPTVLLFAQASTPSSDPQAISYAAQAMQALTQSNIITDVTLTGAVTWNSSSDSYTGTATLSAKGTTESRLDLTKPS